MNDLKWFSQMYKASCKEYFQTERKSAQGWEFDLPWMWKETYCLWPHLMIIVDFWFHCNFFLGHPVPNRKWKYLKEQPWKANKIHENTLKLWDQPKVVKNHNFTKHCQYDGEVKIMATCRGLFFFPKIGFSLRPNIRDLSFL